MRKYFIKIFSAVAALTVLMSFTSCKDNSAQGSDTSTEAPLSSQQDNSGEANGEIENEVSTEADNESETDMSFVDIGSEYSTESVTQAPQENNQSTTAPQTSAVNENTTKTDNKNTTAKTTAKNEEKTTAKESDGPQTKAEVIAYFNKAANAVKSNKAGFTKKYVRDAAGDIEGLPDALKTVIKKNSTETLKKGKSSDDKFPAAGFSWSSKLRESDVESYEIKEQGKYYIITLRLGKEKNPAEGEASSYGRCMSVVTVGFAESILGVEDASMDYHDGYVRAKIDSKTGRMAECEFSASADISATFFGKNLKVNNIKSTETFTDFIW